MKRVSSHPERIVFLIFVIVGAIFLVAGLILSITTLSTEGKVYTEGIITRILSSDDSHTVYVTYLVDGIQYTSKLNYYSSSFYEGKHIEIYYYIDNISNIGSREGDYLTLIFPGLGLIFFLVGVIGIGSSSLAKVKYKKLKENGLKEYADFVMVKVNYSISVNRRFPYQIICQTIDPFTHETITFKSANIWFNPQKIIDDYKIEVFPVYHYEGNYKKYYLDISEVTAKNNYLK